MPEVPQKQLILTNALKRMRRVSIYADFRFRARRQDVLAAYSSEGQQCFTAMTLALEQCKLSSGKTLEATETLPQEVEDSFKAAALIFVAEPAQRSVIERIELGNLRPPPPEQEISAMRISTLDNIICDDVGRLAWGAFSLKKVQQFQSVAIEERKHSDGRPTFLRDQLSLQDLSIICCAASYQDRQFDCSFMRQLSTSGANIVHRIAMILATDYRTRIDLAIITAAKVLSDPVVGGDADHCYCMLKAHQFPPSWALRYGLD